MKITIALPLALAVVHCAPEPSSTAPPATPAAPPATAAAATPPAEPAAPAAATPAAAAAPVASSAQTTSSSPPAAPDAIAVPAGTPLILKAAAKGAQIYACKPKAGAPNAYEWSLKAPDAELFDEKGQKIGKHYAGPTWEATDGSKVVAKLHSKVDAPAKTAVAWLLLDVKSSEGAGVLSKVKSIQRLETSGGQAPATGCDAAHKGAETRVDYSATYYMYGQ